LERINTLKKLLLITPLCLASCTLVTLPVAVIETTASIAKIPISVVGSVADAVNGDEEEGE
jgi:hypothetical protein